MITAVTHVTRYVRNEDEALAFYRDVLGFELNTDNSMGPGKRWLTVNAPGQKHFEIVLYNPVGWEDDADAREQALAQIGKQAQLMVSTSDIDALHAKLQEKNVQIMHGINDMPWGRDMGFRDLDGNPIYVVQPKAM
jgi:catechol 2,3-dioxygenase-like lactoylglutathione lyase family enzyme